MIAESCGATFFTSSQVRESPPIFPLGSSVLPSRTRSRNYNPEPKLGTITTPVLWINSADDFINPPELGIAQKLVTRMPHAKFILIPISEETHGHGTHTQAAIWKDYLIAFLAETAKK